MAQEDLSDLIVTKTPLGIWIIAMFNLLIGIILLILGMTLAYFQEFPLQISDMEDPYVVYGSALRIFGGFAALTGMFSILLTAGLALKKEWARGWDQVFFIAIIILGLIGVALNFYIMCSITIVIFVVICIACLITLRKPNVAAAFDPYGYDKTGVQRTRTDPSATLDSIASIRQTEAAKQEEVEVTVPDNMMLCPNCEALNLISVDFCKTCATDLHPDEEEVVEEEVEEEEVELFRETIEKDNDSI